MLKLFCRFIGEAGNAIPVDIRENETVGDLTVRFAEKTQFAGRVDKLQLVLAKTEDGAWLPDNDELDKMLQTKVDTSKMMKLRGVWRLDKPELFGSDASLGEDVVHVLVEVSGQEGTSNEMSAAPIPLTVEQTKMVVSDVFKERDEKASEYSFSKLDTAKEKRIVKKMRLTENVPDIQEPVDTSIEGYTWIPNIAENEESQRAGYMAYLQQHLKMLIDRGNFLLDDIAGDKSVLNIVDPRLPFAMKGTADVLLINRTSKNPLIKLAGVSLVIELKKKVEPGNVPQAIGQLVSCSMKAPLNCYPLSLLTDLNDNWHFSWFSDKHVLTQVTLKYPKNAFRFIEAAVLRQTESAPLPLSFFPEPFKTIKVDDFLLQPDDGHAEEMMERYELMADVVEPEFLLARRMEYAQHMVQSMPMYAHMYA